MRNNRKNRINGIRQLVLLCLLTFVFCRPVPASDTATGRYVETVLEGPGNDEGVRLYTMRVLEDGRLRAVGKSSKTQTLGIWDSQDLGDSWEKTELPKQLEEAELLEAAIAGDGSVAMVYFESDASDPEGDLSNQLAIVDADGTFLSAQGDALYRILAYTQDQQLLGMQYAGSVAVIDPAAAAAEKTLVNEGVDLLAVCGQEALILTHNDVLRYDCRSLEPLEADPALTQALFASGNSYADETGFGHKILFAEGDGGRLFYLTRDGVYTHIMDGSTVEQIIDGQLCSFASPDCVLMSFVRQEDVFLVNWWDENGQSQLVRYRYDENAPARPTKEITVYSLYEKDSIRKLISAYRSVDPNVYVNYVYGLTGEGAVTVSDALRTLSTDILSGSGPDILVMDGMDIAAYSDRGMLADITDLLEDIAKSEGLLENIALSYAEEKKLYAAPCSFRFPILTGPDELVGQVKDLQDLLEFSEKQPVLSGGMIALLPLSMGTVMSPTWYRADRTIDAQALEAYLTQLCMLYEESGASLDEEMKEYLDMWLEENGQLRAEDSVEYNNIAGCETEILRTGGEKLFFGLLWNATTYSGILSANAAAPGEQTSALFAPMGLREFVPVDVLGILNTAQDPETAGDFVHFAFSAQAQRTNDYNGFPVNQTALEELLYTDPFTENGYTVASSDGTEWIELTFAWPRKEEIDQLADWIRSLDTKTQLPMELLKQLTDQSFRAIRKECTPQEAAASIVQTMDLMLAEG